MSIIQKAIEQSIANLNVAGCLYKITSADGKVYTNIAEEAPQSKRQRKVPIGTYYKVYNPIVKDMVPGDLRQIHVPDELNVSDVRSAVCAYGTYHWGADSYTTEINGQTITVLRN